MTLEVPIRDKSGRVSLYFRPDLGQLWERTDERTPWRIVRIDEARQLVGLSGPGPCRSHRTVSFGAFKREWAPSVSA